MEAIKARILVLDDDLSMLDCVRMSLSTNPDYLVTVVDNPQEAFVLLESNTYNVVITDITMPISSGLDVLEAMGRFDPKVPVILMTGEADMDKMRQAIQLGAFDFLHKPFEIVELLFAVRQAINKNQLMIQNENYRNHLENIVEQRTLELFAAKNKLEKHYLNTIHAMVNAMEASDIYTRGHSERVTILSIMLGKMLGISAEELKVLRIGALLHDLGKIGIYDSLLNKKQSLTVNEYEIIKQHPVIGEKIIRPIGLPQNVHDIILQHHEWYNGNGYPYGVAGDDISPLARIVSVADSFDAMTSQRAYRQNLDPLSASLEIKDKVGEQFDPDFGRLFYEHYRTLVEPLGDAPAARELLFDLL